MKKNKEEIEDIIQQIADVLLINGGFLSNPGLYTGEMGLVLFFSRYARYTQNDLYMEYCFGLIEEIQNRIYRDTSINYKYGLTGIGSAIEYLVQNRFFEADTDEILEDFDKRIFLTYNLMYLPVDDIMDIRYYVNWRMSGNSKQKEKIRQYILLQIEKAIQDKSVDYNPATAIFNEKTLTRCRELISKNSFWIMEAGLQNGLAGWGLSLLTALDDDDSWLILLPDELPHKLNLN